MGHVTIQGYREVHVRIGKTIFEGPVRSAYDLQNYSAWPVSDWGGGGPQHDEWDHAEALQLADDDWTEDVSRFSGDASIKAWFSKVRAAP